jgi:glutamate-5-semialdehyde dehydrogenase
MDFDSICASLKKASEILSVQSESQKNLALESAAESLQKNRQKILDANSADVENARKKNTAESLVERLELNEKKFAFMLEGIQTVIRQSDPVGKVESGWRTKEGLLIRKVRFPLGVASIIYESRPNVTVDAFALAYKSGNSILLRGSSSALESNRAIVSAIEGGLEICGVKNSVFLCTGGERSEVSEILNARGKIDVVLPRGSASLINFVVENSKIPVIQTGAGVCHIFVDESASVKMAAEISANAKMQRPGACNAAETILVHEKIAQKFLPEMAKKFGGKVQLRADEKSFEILNSCGYENLLHAAESDFGFEFLDFIASVKIVDSLQSAIDFINAHNTRHSETIVTNDFSSAKKFQAQVDASCVYVNASTRFTDGGVFGFGAELGISTQKLHARGPMGAEALTTTKFLIDGDGQIRS